MELETFKMLNAVPQTFCTYTAQSQIIYTPELCHLKDLRSMLEQDDYNLSLGTNNLKI